MEIPELKVVALMLTSSKLPLIFCATSGCREMTIFLIFILRIWIQIRIRIHNSCLPSEKTIWSKKTTFYGEMPELKDVSVLQLLIQVFNPNLHNWVVKVTYMVAIRKDNLVKKTTFHGEMPEVKVVALILKNSKLPLNLLCHFRSQRNDDFPVFVMFGHENLQVLLTKPNLSRLSKHIFHFFFLG